MGDLLSNAEMDLLNLENELANTKNNIGKTFPKEDLLKDKLSQKAELDFQLETELKQTVPSNGSEMEDDYEVY